MRVVVRQGFYCIAKLMCCCQQSVSDLFTHNYVIWIFAEKNRDYLHEIVARLDVVTGCRKLMLRGLPELTDT